MINTTYKAREITGTYMRYPGIIKRIKFGNGGEL